MLEISVGHTPDSDDAFMFYGMLTGRIRSPDFMVRHVIEDIQSLNQRALNPDLDVTAVSVHACAYIPRYTVMRSGGSFGLGYGPIVISKRSMDVETLKGSRIAIPGKMTSAFLLLQLMIGRFEAVEMGFDRIPQAVSDGIVDAGLVIHETQLSYKDEGNTKILDVGKWWTQQTDSLPVPLGINVIRTGLGEHVIAKFDRHLNESIRYGLEHFDDALNYAMQYSRGKDKNLISEFVKMYVNDVTVDMGERGVESIRLLFSMARQKGLVPEFDLKIAPPLEPST